jgi:hypothetical protein
VWCLGAEASVTGSSPRRDLSSQWILYVSRLNLVSLNPLASSLEASNTEKYYSYNMNSHSQTFVTYQRSTLGIDGLRDFYFETGCEGEGVDSEVWESFVRKRNRIID